MKENERKKPLLGKFGYYTCVFKSHLCCALVRFLKSCVWFQTKLHSLYISTKRRTFENFCLSLILFECVSKFHLAEKKFGVYMHFNCHIHIYITYSVTCNYLPPQSLSPMEHTSHYLHICKNRPHRRPYCQFKINDTAMDDRVRWKQFLNCLKNLQKRGHQDVKCKCKYRNIVPFCKHFN